MFEINVAADIGSKNTRIAVRNAVISDESRAALDMDNARAVLAVGRASRKLLNTVPAYPTRGGINDAELTALMLRRMTLDLIKRRSLIGTRLSLAVNPAAGDPAFSALLEVGRAAGFSKIRLVDGLMAGAVGAGVDVGSGKARMVVDIGRDSVGILAAANGGVLLEKRLPFGSFRLDRLIQAYFASEEHMLISCRTAEAVKLGLGKPRAYVHGTDSRTGAQLMRFIQPRLIREAAGPAVMMLENEIVKAIGELSPDAAADLIDTGIVLIGGGAKRFGLSETLETDLGIPVKTAANAESAAILGMRQELSGPRRISVHTVN